MNPPTTKPTKQPKTDTTSDRVVRGGGWRGNGPSWVRAASRNTLVPALRSYNIGFRCALRAREPRV